MCIGENGQIDFISLYTNYEDAEDAFIGYMGTRDAIEIDDALFEMTFESYDYKYLIVTPEQFEDIYVEG